MENIEDCCKTFTIVKEQRYMRAEQLAIYFGIGLSTVWLFAKQGRITPKKITPKITVFDVREAEKNLLS